jgi:hypothetical protein
MKFLRASQVKKIVCMMLGLIMFNFSIDPPDMLENLHEHNTPNENLSFNEIESILEFVLEKAFHIKNAIPEADEWDYEKDLLKIGFCGLVPLASKLPEATPKEYNIFQSCRKVPHLLFESHEILSPPPEAA